MRSHFLVLGFSGAAYFHGAFKPHLFVAKSLLVKPNEINDSKKVAHGV